MYGYNYPSDINYTSGYVDVNTVVGMQEIDDRYWILDAGRKGGEGFSSLM